MSFKIMIVDDSRTTRTLFENILPTLFSTEIKIIEASDGDEGFVRLEDNPDIDLIFLDINMPGMMGDQFLDILKFKDEYKDIKVIIASTESSDEIIETFIDSGANGFIVKPISPANILNTLITLGNEMKLDLNIPKTTNTEKTKEKVVNILVVDDSKTIQRMYKFNLPRLFKDTINLYSASNGKEALAMLDTHPDTNLIFLDINMPIMDGYEFLDKLKSIPKYTDIKIIMATTEASKEMITKMYKAGANAYLTKPFKLQSLCNTLDRLNSECALDFGLNKLKPDTTSQDISSNQKLKIMIVDDSKTIRRMYSDFLPKVIKKDLELFEATNGKEAVELLQKNSDISIMFLDQNMPVMDGDAALKTIRLIPKFNNLKVIICTADDSVDHQQALIVNGADDFIVKPFKKEALIKVLKKIDEKIVDGKE